MNLFLHGGLNMNDPLSIGDTETAISENADYRQDGVVRSRDGRSLIYSNAGGVLIGGADGNIYSFGTGIFKNGVSLSTTITDPIVTGSMHLYNTQTEACFLASAINYKIVGSEVFQWGISPPTSASTIAYSGTGLTGTFYYKYTYVRKVGGSVVGESNPSPVSATCSPANQEIVLTPTQSSDGQVTHIRFYRTLNNGVSGGDDFYYDGEISAGTVTFTTSTSDSALGSLIETDNNIPPDGIVSITGPGSYQNLFVAVGNKIHYSKPSKPESFPSDYYTEVGTPYYSLQAIVDWGGQVYAFNKEGVYYLQGTSYNTFFATRTMASKGLFSKHGIAPTEKGIMYLGDDGIYAFNGQAEAKLTDTKVDPIFRGDTVNGINPLNKAYIDNCWMSYFNGKLFLGYPDANEEFPNKVLMYDFIKQKFSIYDYGKTLKCGFVDKVNQRLLVGDSDGKIWRLEYGEDDYGDSFALKVRSKKLTVLAGVTPSIARFDIYNEGGNTISARLMRKGDVVYTYNFTDSDDHKRRVLPPISLESFQLEIESDVSSRVKVGVISLE